MKKILFVFIVLLLSCNTNNNKIVEGYIYVKLIDLQNLKGASDEQLENFRIKIQDSAIIKTLNQDDKELWDYYKYLFKHDLADKPFFKLKLSNDSIINVFTNEKEYLQIKDDLENLDRDKEKIYVKFKGKEKEKGIYYTDNILTFEKQEGQTDWDK